MNELALTVYVSYTIPTNKIFYTHPYIHFFTDCTHSIIRRTSW